LFSITHIELLRIRELRIVTFGALTTTGPEMSRPSTTAPAVLIVNPPLAVNTVPAGTPVLDASGYVPGAGVGVGDGEGLGDGVGVADGSTRSKVLVCDAVRLRASVTFSVTVRGPAAPVYVNDASVLG